MLIKLVKSGEDGPEEFGFEAESYHIRRKWAQNESEFVTWLNENGYTTYQMPFGEPNTPCTMRILSIDEGRKVVIVQQSQANIYVMSNEGRTLDAYRAS